MILFIVFLLFDWGLFEEAPETLPNDVFDDFPIGVAMGDHPPKLSFVFLVVFVEGDRFLAGEEFFCVVITLVRFLLVCAFVPQHFESRVSHFLFSFDSPFLRKGRKPLDSLYVVAFFFEFG